MIARIREWFRLRKVRREFRREAERQRRDRGVDRWN